MGSLLPKRTFVHLNRLKFGAYEAVHSFNSGNISKCKILQGIGLSPGKNCVSAMMKLDKRTVAQAEKAILELETKIRQKRSLAKRRLEHFLEEAEDPDNPTYAPGMH